MRHGGPRRSALFLAMASVALFAIAGPSPDSYEADIAALEALLRQDPIKRATSSIEKGDFRLLGVRGYAVEIPGVDHRLSWCKPIRDNVNVIEGTSDDVGGDKHLALIGEARKYAARYNSFVANHKQFKVPSECKAP